MSQPWAQDGPDREKFELGLIHGSSQYEPEQLMRLARTSQTRKPVNDSIYMSPLHGLSYISYSQL